MQARPTASQRRIRALLLVLAAAALSWSMIWGLARLLDYAFANAPKKPERVEISLVDPPSDDRLQVADAPKQNIRTQRPRAQKTPTPARVPLIKPKPPEKETPKKPKSKPPTPPKERLKMVEQDPESKTSPPDKANYFSNVDRKVKEQTRAKNAKLDSKRPRSKPQTSTPQKPKVAARRQKKREAKVAKKKGSSLLTMRGTPKAAAPASRTKDALRAREHGQLQKTSPSAASTPPGQHGSNLQQRPRLALGGSAAAMQAAVRPQDASQGTQRFAPPQKEGLWDKARKNYTSPLDNVVPEVRPGNQTALNSRRHPFAQYIAEMHRSIHSVWGDGVLRAWDRLPRNHAWNDFSLWTRVEIVLWPSGEIDTVKTVRRSGNSSFDGVARNSVYNAAPYPEAPEEIHSGNGKIYIHWAFHRNAYACGTFGAEPFILDNAGQGARPDPSAPIDEGAVPSETRRRVYGPSAPTK